MRRKTDDLCLLCNERHATKRNSHIASKFLGKSILGEDDGPKKAYIIDSSKPHIKPKISQDSPKEDYILCPECEKYFEVLETYSAEHFVKRILNKKYEGDFEYAVNPGGVEFAICTNIETRVLRLFIISLFWRCSITAEEPFTQFKIRNENFLRDLLLESFAMDVEHLMKSNSNDSLYDFPLVLLRSKNDLDKSSNVLYANDTTEGLYQLILNEYIFFIAFDKGTKLNDMEFLNNIGKDQFIVGLMGDNMWTGLIKGLLDLAAEKANKKAKILGVKPYNINS